MVWESKLTRANSKTHKTPAPERSADLRGNNEAIDEGENSQETSLDLEREEPDSPTAEEARSIKGFTKRRMSA